MANGICDQFAKSGKCRFGKKCKFTHISSKSDGKPAAKGSEAPSKPRPKHDKEPSELEERLQSWRFKFVPQDKDINRAHPLMSTGLSDFMKQALELVEVGTETMQAVITSLASNGGLLRIRQLLSQRFDLLKDIAFKTVWTSQLRPFFRILSHETVLRSLVVENSHATLVNYLYGSDGSRATALFEAAVRYLKSDGSCKDDLHMCTVVLASLLQSSTLAQASPRLKTTVQKILPLTEGSSRFLERHLRTIRVCLNLEIPEALSNHRSASRPRAEFTVELDLPGALGHGPRHDNDHEDVGAIQILPTAGELLHPQTSRVEYLPSEDPIQWHETGVAGLLDRHFRLVREDTVGQLRDAAHAELAHLMHPKINPRKEHTSGARTNLYHNPRLANMDFDDHDGLLLVIAFDQPSNVRNRSKEYRQTWWQDSMRLESDSLICLLSSTGASTFLVVHREPPPAEVGKSKAHYNHGDVHKKYTLARDDRTAFVVAQLASDSGHAVSDFLSQMKSKDARRTLVEFPGMILPAFAPTLSALQKMKAKREMPFVDALIPGNSLSKTSPPAYSTQPGFQWKLPGDERNMVTAFEQTTLDTTQQEAVRHALTHSLALIQGPPGTGKSYTGVEIIKTLLDNRDTGKLGPIICVCFTNHALDQLLEHLLDKDVKQIIRIGSRSKSERLDEVNIRKVSMKYGLTKTEKSSWWHAKQAIEAVKDKIGRPIAYHDNLSRKEASFVEIWLKDNRKAAHDQLFQLVDEDDFEIVRGQKDKSRPLREWLNGGSRQAATPDRALDTLESGTVKLKSMTHGERQTLYHSWVQIITQGLYDEIDMRLSSFGKARKSLDTIRGEVDLRVLSDANVIGVTTTGLARSLEHLRKLPSKVLVVEEAGEVLEAHLLTALLPSLEHAILIGDHQQLRPKVSNYDLSIENPRCHNALDISLFERLISPRVPGSDASTTGLPFVTLETQRRMHPSVSELIRSTLYPNLEDADRVKDYPEVCGMRHRLYWLDHDHLEEDRNDQLHKTSHKNLFEANMVAALAYHLVLQGVYKASDIAVLTPYLGQLGELKHQLGSKFGILPTLNDRDLGELGQSTSTNEPADTEANAQEALKEDADEEADEDASAVPSSGVRTGNLLDAVRLATVDNFQGEEAKVIIISLVRSNNDHKVGFLRTPNRINVLLSRAKHGMYIIGNSQTAERIPMWKQVTDILEAGGNIGPVLELCCPRHPETPLQVKEAEDFERVAPEAGCDLLCSKQLPKCGHSCPKKCHADSLHNAVRCLKDCPRPKKGCEHPCKLVCGDACEPRCTEVVENIDIQLECGHRVTSLPCWQYQDPKQVQCEVPVERIVPGCDHKVTVACCLPVTDPAFMCTAKCTTILECGHTCKKKCFSCRPRDGEKGTIMKVDHGPCTQVCECNYTTCEHSCQSLCHDGEDCPLCKANCGTSCIHSGCPKECSEPCTPCAEERCSSQCPHSECRMPCAAPCDWVPCSKRCDKLLDCGHQCPSMCGEECPSTKYCHVCAKDGIQDMPVDLYTMETYQEIKDLDVNPCIYLPCGHIFTVESLDGLMEMSKYYEIDDKTGHPVEVKADLAPLSDQKPKSCPSCRGSLRKIARYGRIVRRSLLDESTKKFIAWSNSAYLPLAQELQKQQSALQASIANARLRGELKLDGSRLLHKALPQPATTNRYLDVLRLRKDIINFMGKVDEAEQPFQKVSDGVEAARRRQIEHTPDTPKFDFDKSILQTRGKLLANALLVRCDLIIVTDVLTAYEKMDARSRTLNGTKPLVNFTKNRQTCTDLLESAQTTKNVLQQAEAHIFWAQFAALECNAIYQQAGTGNVIPEKLKDEAKAHLADSEALCTKYPGQTASVVEEIKGVRQMLEQSISAGEMRMVVAAMATEFSGTGHWYRCVNGHPFTIGECGGPMQTSTCPQCGEAVGGERHRAAEGVSRADDLEREFGGLRV